MQLSYLECPLSQPQGWVLQIEPHKLEPGSKEGPSQLSEEFSHPTELAGFL